MGRPTVFASRLIVFLVGAALLVGGAYGVAHWAEVALADSLAERMDRLWYYTAAEQQWWPWALGASAALCLVIGAALIVAVARPRHHGTADLAQRSLGLLSVDPGAVGDAVASSIEGIDGVLKAQARAREIAGVPTMSITITIDPRTELDPLRTLLEATTAETTASFGPNAPQIRYFIRAQKV